MIKIIAAIGKNRELGKNGKLIWDLPNDLKFFKEQTTGCIVVVGKNTFNSLPGKLSNRQHYILTDDLKFDNDVKDVDIFFDFEELLKQVQEDSKTTDVYIIGGAMIYKQFLEYAEQLILTEIEATDPYANVYFPYFNKEDYIKTIMACNEDNGIKYTHVKYTKINKLPKRKKRLNFLTGDGL